MGNQLITTNDGSSSIFVPELNETYHSIHGAVQEAKHVFVKMGLESNTEAKSLTVLEVGYGTGLNAALTYEYSERVNQIINYIGIEKYPVENELLKQLNYKSFFYTPIKYDEVIEAHWEKEIQLSSSFTIQKKQCDILDIEFEEKIDVVFFDAFAPNKQEKMWSLEVFKLMFKAMKKGAVLVTYCCQGEVKRTMKKAGFLIEKLPGPPGKREMLRAIKE